MLIFISLVTAYYMQHLQLDADIEENIIFGDIPEIKMTWKHPSSFITALEMWYMIGYWHFTSSDKASFKANLKRGRCLLMIVLAIFLILMVFSVYEIFHIDGGHTTGSG